MRGRAGSVGVRGAFWEDSDASDQEGLLPPVFGGWGLGFTLSWRRILLY